MSLQIYHEYLGTLHKYHTVANDGQRWHLRHSMVGYGDEQN